MKRYKKILLWWLTLVLIYSLAMVILPHKDHKFSGIASILLEALLGFICIFIVKNETNRRNKFIIFNFILFFALSLPGILYTFIGKAFLQGEKYASFFAYQYYILAYIFFLSLSIIYFVIDLLFREFKIYQKYIASLGILFLFFSWYFLPILKDPLYVYKTEEIKQWKVLSTYVDPNSKLINLEELSKRVNLKLWRDGLPIGDLNPEENLKRMEELLPYLSGNNFIVLLDQTLFKGIISMDVLLVVFIMLFFGYQYKKDPPQGAYLDKIMFTFLLFISTDILHSWGFIKSVEWFSMEELFTLGQYVTNIILIIMIVFFSLRLNFITSIQGEFYETELASNPQHISRWRDAIDNLVLKKFFNIKPFHGRLFQRTGK